MAKLSNPKRESFAQQVARGVRAVDAYAEAGYRPSAANASVLLKHPSVAPRIEEIRREIQRALQPPQEFDPEAVDKNFLLAEFYQQVLMARDSGELKIANDALEKMGKLVGALADGSGNKAKIAPGEKVERAKVVTTDAKEVSEVHRFIERLADEFGDEPENGDPTDSTEAAGVSGPDSDG